MSLVHNCINVMKKEKPSLKDLINGSDTIYIIIENKDYVEAFKRRGKKVRKLMRFETGKLLRIVNNMITYLTAISLDRVYHGLIVRYIGYYIYYNEEKIKLVYYIEYDIQPFERNITMIFVKTMKVSKFFEKFFRK